MFYMLATVLLGGLALLAPRVAAVAIALSLVVTLTVKLVTRLVSNVEPTLGESFKAVCYGIGLGGLALAMLIGAGISVANSGGTMSLSGAAGQVVFALLLACYVAGFKGALGTGWRASAVVAFAASVVSIGFLFSVRNIA
jgi:hypothetical protein